MSIPFSNKILVVNPGPVYPVKSMSQRRTHNMIKTLSKDFTVNLLTPYIDSDTYECSRRSMTEFGGEYIPIISAKHKGNFFKKRIAQLIEYLNYFLLGIDKEVTAYKRNNSKILKIIIENGYRVVISNYWEGSLYYNSLGSSIFKILDPHYAVVENFDVLSRFKSKRFRYFIEKRRLKNNLRYESMVIKASDLLMPLSNRNYEEFLKISQNKPMLFIPDGADLEYFLSFPVTPDPSTIIFYGAMGSQQNKRAFWRLYNNIFPCLKKEFPELRLLTVGSNPPEDIRALKNGKDIIVTDYVEDVRPWIAQAWLCLIPLELGSGFRGRVIELMAMGIPVVGTQNALESIGFKSDVHGFIADSNEELISISKRLLSNKVYRNQIGENAREFVKSTYTLESTFGKLNSYLKNRMTNGEN